MRAGDTYAESVKSVNTSYHQDKVDEAEYIWSTNLYKCTTTRRDQESDIILFNRTFHATSIKAPK